MTTVGNSGGSPLGFMRRVKVSEIAVDDHSVRFTVGGPAKSLVESISQWGCLVPPIVKQGASKLGPITGFKRLEALRETHGSDTVVDVRFLDGEIGVLRAISVAAADQRRDRPLNPFEVSRAVRIGMQAGLTRPVVAKHLLPLLGADGHETVLKRFLKLQRVPPVLIPVLEDKGVNLKRALEFVRVPAEGAELLVKYATELGLSVRAMEEWSRMWGDIALRDLCSWREVAHDSGLTETAANSNLSAPDRAKKCGRILRRLRYPLWAQALDTTRLRLGKMEIPDSATVQWDDRFEAEGLTMKIQVKDASEFETQMASLLAPDQIKRLKDLLDSL